MIYMKERGIETFCHQFSQVTQKSTLSDSVNLGSSVHNPSHQSISDSLSQIFRCHFLLGTLIPTIGVAMKIRGQKWSPKK